MGILVLSLSLDGRCSFGRQSTRPNPLSQPCRWGRFSKDVPSRDRTVVTPEPSQWSQRVACRRTVSVRHAVRVVHTPVIIVLFYNNRRLLTVGQPVWFIKHDSVRQYEYIGAEGSIYHRRIGVVLALSRPGLRVNGIGILKQRMPDRQMAESFRFACDCYSDGQTDTLPVI